MANPPGELEFGSTGQLLTLARSIESTTVRTVAYDDVRQILRVEFSTGASYDYFGVPAWIYEGLLESEPHPWTALGRVIRSHPARRATPPKSKATS